MGNAPPHSQSPPPPNEPINLMRGWPAPSLLPADLIKRAAHNTLSDPTTATDALLYGPDPGYEPCREALAHWLTAFYQPKQAVTASRLCVTGGASQNLGCVLSVYTDPEYTRAIWIVEPAYMLAFRVFEDAGFGGKGRMRAVPEDEEGVDLSYLRQELEKSEKEARRRGVERPVYKPERQRAKVYKHVIYCVPTFANPSSRTMSLQHRKDLVRIAREYDALLVTDDVYDMLQWPAHFQPSESQSQPLDAMKTAHLPRLVDIDRELSGGPERQDVDGFGNAISNGSFSKIIGPGVRVGWSEGSEKFTYGLSQCGTTASGGAPSQLTSTYITLLLNSGDLDKHIAHTLRPAYAARYRSLLDAIGTYLLPLSFTLPQPDREVVGGYFVWLGLPSRLNANTFARRCREEEDVIIAPGPIFEVPGDGEAARFDGHVRLCWAWEEERKLGEGVRRIGEVAGRMLEDNGDAAREVNGKDDDGGRFEKYK